MKLALVNLTGGGLSGGYRKYLQQLVPVLRQDPRVTELVNFIPPKAVLPPDCGPTLTWQGNSTRQAVADLNHQLQALRPEVVFIPNFWHCRPVGIPVVIMIHNMEMVAMPIGRNSFADILRNLARRTIARRSCRRATRVVAVSRYVKDYLVNQWRVPAGKLDVIYHGQHPPGDPSSFQKPAAMAGFDRRPFLFTAGSIRTYRGLEDLIQAAAQPALKKHGLPIVIAGGVDPGSCFYQRRLDRLIRKHGVGNRILFTGHLSEPEMHWCYHHCTLYVMTSRVEACPNTSLEALSHGCGVVSTDNPPMPEFFREAAWYYRAGDGGGLARQVDAALGSTVADQEGRRARGREIAAEFTWKRTAAETMDCLLKAVADGAPFSVDRKCP